MVRYSPIPSPVLQRQDMIAALRQSASRSQDAGNNASPWSASATSTAFFLKDRFAGSLGVEDDSAPARSTQGTLPTDYFISKCLFKVPIGSRSGRFVHSALRPGHEQTFPTARGLSSGKDSNVTWRAGCRRRSRFIGRSSPLLQDTPVPCTPWAPLRCRRGGPMPPKRSSAKPSRCGPHPISSSPAPTPCWHLAARRRRRNAAAPS